MKTKIKIMVLLAILLICTMAISGCIDTRTDFEKRASLIFIPKEMSAWMQENYSYSLDDPSNFKKVIAFDDDKKIFIYSEIEDEGDTIGGYYIITNSTIELYIEKYWDETGEIIPVEKVSHIGTAYFYGTGEYSYDGYSFEVPYLNIIPLNTEYDIGGTYLVREGF